MDLHLSLSPSGPHRNAGPSLPPTPSLEQGWGTEGSVHPAGALRSIRHQGQGQGGGLSPPLMPPFWSLVFLFAPRGLSTWQRKKLWNGGFLLLPGGAWDPGV